MRVINVFLYMKPHGFDTRGINEHGGSKKPSEAEARHP